MKPIVCRVNPRLWWMVPVGLAETFFLLAAPFFILQEAAQPRSVGIIIFLFCLCWGMGAFFVYTTLWMIAELTRGEVIADENGLRWRREFAGWKRARWDEISDFYLHRTQVGTHTLETPHGQLQLSATYPGIKQIIELVPQRAVNARAHAWDMRGFGRDADWEQTLSLWSKGQKWTAPAFTLLILMGAGAFIALLFLEPRHPKPALGIFWLDVFPLVLAALFFGVMAMGMIWATLSMWRERKFAWQRRDETLHLSARGLTFENETERVEATWEQVQKIGRMGNQNGFERIRVETKSGDFVLWHSKSSTLWPMFRARCESYAPAALEALRASEVTSLEQEIDPPQSAEEARVFSFRTVSNRLILICVSVALLFAPIFYLILLYQSTGDSPFAPWWPLFWGALALGVLIVGTLWLWFARARIVADAEGLQLHSPFRPTRHVRWDSIETSGRDAWGDYLRVGGRKIYWVRGLSPARRDELTEIITASLE